MFVISHYTKHIFTTVIIFFCFHFLSLFWRNFEGMGQGEWDLEQGLLMDPLLSA